MKIITVGDETKRLIDDQALPGYAIRQTATRLPDGQWSIPIDDEVFRHIDSARQPGETDNDTVSRLLRLAVGRKPS